ncbi:phage integrase [Legionella gratiana]|uniref:Phage integrase n=1 Tax=Legionella gratiana TaxID=45066 RepID=A0A378JB61_9GAMM|nr:phage integrase [Legionella gratiana]STX45033.1 phage integrase [Legionella gratiana]
MHNSLGIALVLASMMAQASSSIPVKNNSDIALTLSQSNYNRIVVKNDKIMEAVFPPNSMAVKRDEHDDELWSQVKLESKCIYSWQDAVVRWLKENEHKRSLKDDIMHLRWLDPYLRGFQLHEITRDILEEVAIKKEDTGVTPTTINRMLEVVRAILRKAQMEWE